MHLFDTRRPEGVPWPKKDDPVLYRPALPDRYRSVIQGFNVVGAIEVEASPRLEDNQWVLDVVAQDKLFVGTVGDLEPGQPEFRKQLERFQRNPLFRGIRYGNIWDRNLGAKLADAQFVSDLKFLADANLVLDTANPTSELIAAVVKLTDLVPNLRVVIDHLPQISTFHDADVHADFARLGKRPQVFVKVSEVLRREDGRVPLDLSFYKDRLDALWEIFGQHRLMYGSDWPNCDQWGSYAQEMQIVRRFFVGKGRSAAESYFWKNSITAYRWVKRTKNQPQLPT
jgi:L-fuconolactonase